MIADVLHNHIAHCPHGVLPAVTMHNGAFIREVPPAGGEIYPHTIPGVPFVPKRFNSWIIAEFIECSWFFHHAYFTKRDFWIFDFCDHFNDL